MKNMFDEFLERRNRDTLRIFKLIDLQPATRNQNMQQAYVNVQEL